MKINHNSSNETKVPVNTINTMMEQISNLQEDVSEIQNEIDGLGQSISTVSVDADNAQIDTLNTTNLSATEATVNTLTASVAVNTAEMSASTSHLGNADAGKVDTEILEADTASIDVGTVTALESVDADITRANIDSLSAGNAEVNTLETNGITNTGDYTGKDISAENVTASNTVNTKGLNVTDTANIKDLNISGHVSGVADITLSELETDELKATDSEIKTIKNEGIYTDNSNPLTPTPGLSSDSDRYTIELPTFDGTLILTWKDGNTVRWTATVIGNGVDYGITFGCIEDQTYITELFQWNRHLYIRHRANGQLVYSYNAEKKIEINTTDIYYNMTGWANPKSLEELTDENTAVDVLRPSGTVLFGNVNIPRMESGESTTGGIKYRGSCTINELPSLNDTDEGDVWNITNDGYTDNRFVEDAGKPINAGDDVIAVVEEVSGSEIADNTFNFIPEDLRSYPQIECVKNFFRMSNGKTLCVATVSYSYYSYENGAVILVYEYVDIDNWQLINTLYDKKGQYITTLSVANVIETDNHTLIVFSNGNDYSLGSEDGNICWRSTDYGETFTKALVGTGGAGSLLLGDSPISTSGNNIAMVTGHDYAANILFCSADNGVNWTEIDSFNDPWDPWGSHNVAGTVALPNGVIGVFNTNGQLFTSSDMVNWSLICTASSIVGYGNYTFYYLKDNKVLVCRNNVNNLTYYIVDITDGSSVVVFNENLPSYMSDFAGQYIITNGKRFISSLLYYSDDYGLTWSKLPDIEGYVEVATYQRFAFIDANSFVADCKVYDENDFIEKTIYYTTLSGKYLRWDKFAAGVNYENFVAQNITATTALKSEGTLEIDGTSQFSDDVNVDANITSASVSTSDLEVTDVLTANSTVINATKNITHTGNYTATGNQTITGSLNRTGNETINGTVVIGDLD